MTHQYFCDLSTNQCGKVINGNPPGAVVYMSVEECTQNCPVQDACSAWMKANNMNTTCSTNDECMGTLVNQTSCDLSPGVTSTCVNGYCNYVATPPQPIIQQQMMMKKK